jgi:hypothetical protein
MVASGGAAEDAASANDGARKAIECWPNTSTMTWRIPGSKIAVKWTGQWRRAGFKGDENSNQLNQKAPTVLATANALVLRLRHAHRYTKIPAQKPTTQHSP